MTRAQHDFSVASWTVCPVSRADGTAHEIVVDAHRPDPITQLYLDGLGGLVNRELISIADHVLAPGAQFVDLGAFIGGFSLAAAASGHDVIAVEASHANSQLITASAEINGFHDLRVVNVAAGDEAGRIEFMSAGPYGQVLTAQAVPTSASERVIQVVVDDLLERMGWDRVGLVKIDIEGSEMRALRGMTRTLSKPNAPAILFESNLAPIMEQGSVPQELLAFVESFGYSLYLVDEDLLVEVGSGDFQPRVISDYLALKSASPTEFGLRVRGPLSIPEVASRVSTELRECATLHRQCMGWYLQHAPAELLREADVRRGLDSLVTDAADSVRAAVGWFRNESGLPVPEVPVAVREVVAPTDRINSVLAAENALRNSAETRLNVVREMGTKVQDPLSVPDGPNFPVRTQSPGPMANDVARWLSATADRHPVAAASVRNVVRFLRRSNLPGAVQPARTGASVVRSWRRGIGGVQRAIDRRSSSQSRQWASTQEPIAAQSAAWDRLRNDFLNRIVLTELNADGTPPSLRNVQSQAASSAQCEEPEFDRWSAMINDDNLLPDGDARRYHRKLWEWVYIAEAADQAGLLVPGKRAVGFGVGNEPVPALFASFGVEVLATDQSPEGDPEWATSGQLMTGYEGLFRPNLIDNDEFMDRVRLRNVDMNDVPADLGTFDVVWSSCVIEHLGSPQRGMDFVFESCGWLEPGGIAIHTTELELTAMPTTMDYGHCAVYRKTDLEALAARLEEAGYLADFNFYVAMDSTPDRWVSLVAKGADPADDIAHLKLALGESVSTSFGIVVRRRPV